MSRNDRKCKIMLLEFNLTCTVLKHPWHLHLECIHYRCIPLLFNETPGSHYCIRQVCSFHLGNLPGCLAYNVRILQKCAITTWDDKNFEGWYDVGYPTKTCCKFRSYKIPLSHDLNQCWNILNWILRNKFYWNFNRKSDIFTDEKSFESVICKMLAMRMDPPTFQYDLFSI